MYPEPLTLGNVAVAGDGTEARYYMSSFRSDTQSFVYRKSIFTRVTVAPGRRGSSAVLLPHLEPRLRGNDGISVWRVTASCAEGVG